MSPNPVKYRYDGRVSVSAIPNGNNTFTAVAKDAHRRRQTSNGVRTRSNSLLFTK
jgi:hypothetical protein